MAQLAGFSIHKIVTPKVIDKASILKMAKLAGFAISGLCLCFPLTLYLNTPLVSILIIGGVLSFCRMLEFTFGSCNYLMASDSVVSCQRDQMEIVIDEVGAFCKAAGTAVGPFLLVIGLEVFPFGPFLLAGGLLFGASLFIASSCNEFPKLNQFPYKA